MVDLPAPDGPTIAVIPPGGSSKVRSRCTHELSCGERYLNHTSENAIEAGPDPEDDGLGSVACVLDGSVGRSCTSRIRTTAASPACSCVAPVTREVTGSVSSNRYSRNAISEDTGNAPLATRRPPMPRTARNEIWTASPAEASMRAVQPAPSTPRRHARRAASPTAAISRSSAPLALTVRNAPSVRSSTEPIRPTAAWFRSLARRIRGTTTSTATPFTARTARVTSSSTASSMAISTTEPTSRNVALIEWTSP
jgi:hypothetical protein